MTNLRAAGHLLACSTADRSLTYRLLPFGEPGRTSLGTVIASRGSVTLPADPGTVVLNLEHDPTRPVARAVSLVESDRDLVATFTVAATRAGDDLLAEAAAGLRTGASVELDGVVIRDGHLVASTLTGAGAVVRPAFPSAQLVASDTDPDPDDDDEHTEPDPEPGTATPEEPTVSDTLTAAAPAALPGPVSTGPTELDLPTVTRLLASLGQGQRTPELLAALTDITYTANAQVQSPKWIDEVWSGAPYERSIVPLFGHDTLTAAKVHGWRWKVAPVGGDYTGDKTAVPSNAALTEAVEFVAARWAGGHDHDRAFVDFGDAGYWTSYWTAMAASYAKWSDTLALTTAKAAATSVTGVAGDVVGDIIKTALSVIPAGKPSFMLLGSLPLTELAKIDPKLVLSGVFSIPDANGVLSGLPFGTHPSLAAGDIVIGTRNAATFYELGTAPIRVEGVDIAKGGVDTGAFGYGVLGIHDAAGLAKCTYAPAP